MGEIKVDGAVNGRRITLDPLLEREPLSLPVRRVESAIPCGFRVSGLDGEHEVDGGTMRYDLAAGAGCGSPWMTAHVEMPDGTHRYECVDMRDVFSAWIDAIVAAGPTPEVAGA